MQQPLDRRDFLGLAAVLAGAGLLPAPAQAAWNTAAFAGKNLADVMKGLGAAVPVASREVRLDGPEIAENGVVVPVSLGCTAPGVKRLAVLVEKNPTTLAAVFDVTDAVEPAFATRIKLAETSAVYAVAILADGRVLVAQREIKVTIGGCGG